MLLEDCTELLLDATCDEDDAIEEEDRAELLELFRREMYGRSPGRQEGQHYKVVLHDDNAFGGIATREEVLIYFDASEQRYIRLLVYTPNDAKGPVPAFLYMNTAGNCSVNEDPTINYPDSLQLAQYEIHGYPSHGQARHFYPLEMILARGYAFATFFKADLDPDFDDGFQNGVHPYIYKEGQHFPEPAQSAVLPPRECPIVETRFGSMAVCPSSIQSITRLMPQA